MFKIVIQITVKRKKLLVSVYGVRSASIDRQDKSLWIYLGNESFSENHDKEKDFDLCYYINEQYKPQIISVQQSSFLFNLMTDDIFFEVAV